MMSETKSVKDTTLDNVKSQLAALEDNRTIGYVPKDKEGNVIAKSGVTIGMGFDLGAHSKKELEDMGIDSDVITALEPYLGLKGDKAVNKLATTPLSLTAESTDTINDKVKSKKYDALAAKFKAKVGRTFDDEDDNVREALLIAAFNLGESGLLGNTTSTNLAKQLKEKKYTEAADNLKTWKETALTGLRARRRAEADLLRGDIKVGEVATTKDDYVPDLKIQEALNENINKTPTASVQPQQRPDLKALQAMFPLEGEQPVLPTNRRLV